MSNNNTSLPQWEKHTKGFGSKFLQKFGFQGRLGANEDGIEKAIEVTVRPVNTGIGFGGVDSKKVDQPEEKLKKKSKKVSIIDDLMESEGWKNTKDSTQGRNKKESQKRPRDSDDLFNEYQNILKGNLSEVSSTPIIDMRQKRTKIVNDISELTDNDDMEEDDTNGEEENITKSQNHLIGQELLHNIKVIKTFEEQKLYQFMNEYKREKMFLDQFSKNEQNILQSQKKELEYQIQLKEFQSILIKFEESLKNFYELIIGVLDSDIGQVTIQINQFLSSLKESFSKLIVKSNLKFLESFQFSRLIITIYAKLIDISLKFLHQLLKNKSNYYQFFSFIINKVISNQLKHIFLSFELLKPKNISILNDSDDNDETTDFLIIEDISFELFENYKKVILDKMLLPYFTHQYLKNIWDIVEEPIICIDLIQNILACYSKEFILSEEPNDLSDLSSYINYLHLDSIVENSLIPQFSQVISSYSSKSQILRKPIHSWLLPWLPLLKTTVSSLYPEIRRKYSMLVLNSQWDITLEGHEIIGLLIPWVNIFDKTSMHSLVIKFILPKLVSFIRSSLIITPLQQDFSVYKEILLWYESKLLSFIQWQCLLIGEILPIWVKSFFRYLDNISQLHKDQNKSIRHELKAWFQTWRSMIPTQSICYDNNPSTIDKSTIDLNEISVLYIFDWVLEKYQEKIIFEKSLDENKLDLSVKYKDLLDTLKNNNYYSLMQQFVEYKTLKEKYSQNSNTSKYLGVSHLSQGTTAFSIKELLESLAEKNHILFQLYPNQKKYQTMFEDGVKTIWQLGPCLCYIENNVLFSNYSNDKTLLKWSPITLEDLLDLAVKNTV